MDMGQVYWLSRQRVSLKAAQDAVSAEARLIHYDLAGRYSVKALSAETQAIASGGSFPRAICAGAADGPSNEASHA
jgi:hypothetical protein